MATEDSSPGMYEPPPPPPPVVVGFNQFRYDQHGATDPISDGHYLGDNCEVGGDEQPPGYDRHIIK